MALLATGVALLLAAGVHAEYSTEKPWTGRWFPQEPGGRAACDDPQVMSALPDWNGSANVHTCYESKRLYLPNVNVNPVSECVHIPKSYSAGHICTNMSIEYDTWLPVFGSHRPEWARYGEFKYVPVQRWLHNLEHGAVVMLYHPCANSLEVDRLRQVVKSCLYRHVITPYKLLRPERPLALVTWGCSLTMSMVDPNVARAFIRAHGLQGKEAMGRDGKYSVDLLLPARLVTDADDSTLCP